MSLDLTSLSAKELGSLIRDAQKRKTVIAKRPAVNKVRAQLVKLAKKSGYTLEEVIAITKPVRVPRASTKAAKPAAASGKRKLAKVEPKYRNPANPVETWSGRGKPPRWLAEYLNKGRNREEFLIATQVKPVAATPAAAAPVAAAPAPVKAS